MDMSSCSPLQPQRPSSILFDWDVLMDKSCDSLACDPLMDPGYFSACSSLSPTSSVDSFSLSPNSLQVKKEEDSHDDCSILRCKPQQTATTTKIRAQLVPSSSGSKKLKCRQTASEREKLRMRDLTKALHHLRSFLPASVAPEGQALTKIETLRLTIGYITYLSAQLGLSEEALEQKKTSGRTEQATAIIPLQQTQHSSQPGACPGAYTNPQMFPTGLFCTPHMGWNGQF